MGSSPAAPPTGPPRFRRGRSRVQRDTLLIADLSASGRDSGSDSEQPRNPNRSRSRSRTKPQRKTTSCAQTSTRVAPVIEQGRTQRRKGAKAQRRKGRYTNSGSEPRDGSRLRLLLRSIDRRERTQALLLDDRSSAMRPLRGLMSTLSRGQSNSGFTVVSTLVESDDARSPGDLARDTEPGGRMLAFVRRGSWPGAAGPPAAIARSTFRLRVALFAPLRLRAFALCSLFPDQAGSEQRESQRQRTAGVARRWARE
jgi:hypothetical protein